MAYVPKSKADFLHEVAINVMPPYLTDESSRGIAMTCLPLDDESFWLNQTYSAIGILRRDVEIAERKGLLPDVILGN